VRAAGRSRGLRVLRVHRAKGWSAAGAATTADAADRGVACLSARHIMSRRPTADR
jgi:hypothetical protein